jgi:hypothetical protein
MGSSNGEKKGIQRRQYGWTPERRIERVREMRAMMIASGGMREFRNDTQRRGKSERVRRVNGRFENSSGKSGRRHLGLEVTEE